MAKVCIVCKEWIVGRGSQAKYCGMRCKDRNRPTTGVNSARFRYRTERREYLDTYKMNLGCQICGYNKHPAALTLDHIDPSTKAFTPSHGVTRSWEKFLEEISKCRVLCANCHNIHSQEVTNVKSKKA